MHLRCVSCYGLTAQLSVGSAQRWLSSAWGGCDRQVAKWEQVGKELKAKLEQARQPRLQRAALSLLRLQDETISYIIVCFVLIQSARLPTDWPCRRRLSADRCGRPSTRKLRQTRRCASRRSSAPSCAARMRRSGSGLTG
jgi:hypothetical protein